NHMRQTIQLAFSPSRVLDFGQERQKRGELHGNLGSSDSGCLSKSQRFCVAGILNRLAGATLPSGVAIRTHPLKYRALNSPGRLAFIVSSAVLRMRRGFILRHETRQPITRSEAEQCEVTGKRVRPGIWGFAGRRRIPAWCR